LKKRADDPVAARETTTGNELQASALLAEILEISSSSDSHRSAAANRANPKMHRSQSMNSDVLLPDCTKAKRHKGTKHKPTIQLGKPAPRLSQLQAATPLERASDWPGEHEEFLSNCSKREREERGKYENFCELTLLLLFL
jgi:hypothetical protein